MAAAPPFAEAGLFRKQNRMNQHFSGRLAIVSGKWETVSMAEKRTKADKALRQADQIEKRARHPAPERKKKAPRKASGSKPAHAAGTV